MKSAKLYALIEAVAPELIPISAALRRLFGAAGARLVPILQYAHWGLSPELNRSWAVLDTFDMYSPRYDNPHTLSNVRRWYGAAGFENVDVRYGLNGVVASGCRQPSRRNARNVPARQWKFGLGGWHDPAPSDLKRARNSCDVTIHYWSSRCSP
jgi:hypothetical protein